MGGVGPLEIWSLLSVFVGSFVLVLLLLKLLWTWTVPDLFPGAVEQGLVARSISWFTAGKTAVAVALFAALVA